MRTLAGAIAMTTLLSTPSSAADPLAAERWHRRVLLIFSETARDPSLRRQRADLARIGGDLTARDVVVIEVVGDLAPNGLDGRALRSAFWSGDGFRAVLVGKDGDAKLRRDTPIGSTQLLRVIDDMPMAREEAQKRTGP